MNGSPIQLSQSLQQGLPAPVIQVLGDFIGAAREAFGTEDLLAAVLFGSAAEGRLRATSDVNLLLVLRRFRPEAARAIESQLNFARAAVRLRAIFILQEELVPAAEAFAQKFNDILHRHAVIYGADPLTPIRIAHDSLRARVGQVLLNLEIRLRERLAANWSREDQLAAVIADVVGPIRSCAANILELEGKPTVSPKHALATLAATAADARWHELPGIYSQIRESNPVPGVELTQVLTDTMNLIDWMYRRIQAE